MIRTATLTDIPDLVDMGRKFHAAGRLPGEYTEEATARFLEGLIAGGGVFRSDAGMIGGALAPAYFDPSYVMAVELFWWAEDGQGRRLLRKFEEWAGDAGASEVRMTTLASLPNAERVLGGKYRPIEISYVRAAQWH